MWARELGGVAHAFLSREAYVNAAPALCGASVDGSVPLKRGELSRTPRCSTCTKMKKDGRIVAPRTSP
jgi:hypothetical protein